MGNLLMRRRELILSGGSADPIDQYVQDGLILWLDGIKNTRAGHSDTTTVWEDLSGNERDYTLYSTRVIGDKYIIPKGRATSSQSITSGVSWTTEVCYLYGSSSKSQIFTPQRNTRNTLWISAASNICVGAGGTSGNVKFVAQADHPTINTINSRYYINGRDDIEWSSGTGTWGTAQAQYLFGYNNATGYPMNCRVYALRIYDRTLTDEEILQNYALDRIRFGSGVS